MHDDSSTTSALRACITKVHLTTCLHTTFLKSHSQDVHPSPFSALSEIPNASPFSEYPDSIGTPFADRPRLVTPRLGSSGLMENSASKLTHIAAEIEFYKTTYSAPRMRSLSGNDDVFPFVGGGPGLPASEKGEQEAGTPALDEHPAPLPTAPLPPLSSNTPSSRVFESGFVEDGVGGGLAPVVDVFGLPDEQIGGVLAPRDAPPALDSQNAPARGPSGSPPAGGLGLATPVAPLHEPSPCSAAFADISFAAKNDTLPSVTPITSFARFSGYPKHSSEDESASGSTTRSQGGADSVSAGSNNEDHRSLSSRGIMPSTGKSAVAAGEQGSVGVSVRARGAGLASLAALNVRLDRGPDQFSDGGFVGRQFSSGSTSGPRYSAYDPSPGEEHRPRQEQEKSGPRHSPFSPEDVTEFMSAEAFNRAKIVPDSVSRLPPDHVAIDVKEDAAKNAGSLSASGTNAAKMNLLFQFEDEAYGTDLLATEACESVLKLLQPVYNSTHDATSSSISSLHHSPEIGATEQEGELMAGAVVSSHSTDEGQSADDAVIHDALSPESEAGRSIDDRTAPPSAAALGGAVRSTDIDDMIRGARGLSPPVLSSTTRALGRDDRRSPLLHDTAVSSLHDDNCPPLDEDVSSDCFESCRKDHGPCGRIMGNTHFPFIAGRKNERATSPPRPSLGGTSGASVPSHGSSSLIRQWSGRRLTLDRSFLSVRPSLVPSAACRVGVADRLVHFLAERLENSHLLALVYAKWREVWQAQFHSERRGISGGSFLGTGIGNKDPSDLGGHTAHHAGVRGVGGRSSSSTSHGGPHGQHPELASLETSLMRARADLIRSEEKARVAQEEALHNRALVMEADQQLQLIRREMDREVEVRESFPV